jgi:F0F1-type ATP synthase delta subunit
MSEKDMAAILESLIGLYDLERFREVYVSAAKKLSPEEIDELNHLINDRIEKLAAIRESIRAMRDTN